MAQRMDNPAPVITRWLPTSSEGVDLLTLAPPLFLHHRIGYEHYLGELRRTQYRRLAGDPTWLSHYILSSYIAEVGEMLEQARTIPVIGTIVPSREIILLPAWVIAMAGLAIEIHEQAEALGKKKEESRREEARSLSEHWQAAERQLQNQSLQTTLLAASSTGIACTSSSLRISSLVLPTESALSAETWQKAIENFAKAKVKKRSFWAEELKLGQDLFHFSRTFMMDPHALYDALIRMPEHLDTINGKGQEMLPRVLLYCKQKVVANRWVSDKFDLNILEGKDEVWVKEALPTLKGHLETLASYMPTGQDIEDLTAKYDVRTEEPAPPPPQEVPSPTPAPKGGLKTFAWLGTATFSFWVGRRFFGSKVPIAASVPT